MMRGFLAFLVVVLGLAGAVAYLSLFIVHQNEQALVVQFGDPKRVIREPGLHYKYPFVQTVEYFDKRILDIDTSPQTVLVADKKQLVVDSFARYKIIDPLKYFQRLRSEDRARQQLGVILDSSLRLVLGNVSIEDVVRNKRNELMENIQKRVNAQTAELGVEIVDVRIMRADLPPAIGEAIYRRMQSERQQEAAQFRAEGEQVKRSIQADADRQVTIIKAEATQKSEQTRGEGDAERNQIFNDAFKRDPEFFTFYRSMQAYERSMQSGDTRLVISPNSDFFRYFGDSSGNTPAQATK